MSTEQTPDSPFQDVDQEPGDPGITGSGVLGRLFDGSALGPSVQEMRGEYGLPFHWAVAGRGFCRAAIGDGVPPILEIVFGSALGVVKAFKSGDGLELGEDAVDVDFEPGTG